MIYYWYWNKCDVKSVKTTYLRGLWPKWAPHLAHLALARTHGSRCYGPLSRPGRPPPPPNNHPPPTSHRLQDSWLLTNTQPFNLSASILVGNYVSIGLLAPGSWYVNIFFTLLYCNYFKFKLFLYTVLQWTKMFVMTSFKFIRLLKACKGKISYR